MSEQTPPPTSPCPKPLGETPRPPSARQGLGAASRAPRARAVRSASSRGRRRLRKAAEAGAAAPPAAQLGRALPRECGVRTEGPRREPPPPPGAIPAARAPRSALSPPSAGRPAPCAAAGSAGRRGR